MEADKYLKTQGGNITGADVGWPSITLEIHTNSILKAKKVEKVLELDGASKIPKI